MLALVLYIIGVLCFIAAVVLLAFIPHRAVRITVLILFCLLFIGGMTFLLVKVSGQTSLGSVFDVLSGGQTQTAGGTTDTGDADTDTANTDSTDTDTANTDSTDTDTANADSTDTDTANADSANTDGQEGILGLWYEQGCDSICQLKFNADGTMVYFEYDDPYEGTYTFNAATGAGDAQFMGSSYKIHFDVSTGMLYLDDAPYTRTTQSGSADDTCCILRMWYEEEQGEFLLEFNPDGLVRYNADGEWYAGTYTFDEVSGTGTIDMFGATYDIWYSFDSKSLFFDELFYSCIPPGPEVNRILGMWYAQDEGYDEIGQLEFYSDGTMYYYKLMAPEPGTYVFDDAAAHGDVMFGGYTYEMIYDADTNTLSFEGVLYSRIPW